MSYAPLIVAPSQYPKPLDVVGEKITVLASGAATGSYEVFVQSGVAGSGPEPHYHPWDESFYILHGEVEFNVESVATRIAAAGTLVHVPAGCTHWFRWCEGGGSMLSITSREAASRMFADISAATTDQRPSREIMNEICGRYGCT